MHILITNDDGFRSEGLKALAKEAARRGHTAIVSAPDYQQSAKSHGITLGHPLIVKKRPFIDGIPVHSVQGTPVDAARIGFEVTQQPYDFCVSGINDGFNSGPAVFYSGTVAAAREAALKAVPSIAVSIDVGADEEMLQNAARLTFDIIEKMQGHPMPLGVFATVNLPAIAPENLKEVKACKTAFIYFEDGYEHRQSPQGTDYYWLKGDVDWHSPQEDTDIDYLLQGHVTLSFLGNIIDHTDSFKHLFEA
jgi:5'-nucleotidase